jgi:hypothetical protein
MQNSLVFPRITIPLIILALFATLEARGQDGAPTASTPQQESIFHPRTGPELFEVELGYSEIYKPDDLIMNLYGLNLSGFINATAWLALGGEFWGDFTLEHKRQNYFSEITDERYFYYVFGPRVSLWPRNDLRVFAQLLIGGADATIDANYFSSEQRSVFRSSAAVALGIGGDWRFNPRWSWRVLELNYVGTEFNHNNQHSFQAATGIVYTFGGR